MAGGVDIVTEDDIETRDRFFFGAASLCNPALRMKTYAVVLQQRRKFRSISSRIALMEFSSQIRALGPYEFCLEEFVYVEVPGSDGIQRLDQLVR